MASTSLSLISVSTIYDSILESALASSSPASVEDTLVVAIHAHFLSSGYECVAIGDENFGAATDQTVSSSAHPALPDGWNSSKEVYALQYRHVETKELALVKMIPLGRQLLVSAVAACNSSEVFTSTIAIYDYVRPQVAAPLSSKSVLANLLQLTTVLSRDILTKLTNVCTSAVGLPATAGLTGGGPVLTSERRDVPRPDFDDDPLRVGPPRRPVGRVPPDDPLRVGPPRLPGRPVRDPDPLADIGPFGYGDRDRLPFGGGAVPGGLGGGGGGMIFDPMRQGGPAMGGYGPRGPFPPNHPPGARFDPVTPFAPRPRPPNRDPGRNFYGTPDPDHLPPPGGYDDMFS